MAALDWDQRREDGITLVELAVTADADEQVRVESALTPVWAPRRHGTPAAGWDEAGYRGAVSPEQPLVLGFASPAAPVEPPVSVEATPSAEASSTGESDTATEIIRTLGRNRPPRDVVPTPAPDGTTQAAPGSTPRREDTQTAERAASESGDGGHERHARAETGTEAGNSPPTSGAIDPWFDAVDARLDDAEQLAGVSGADEARGAISRLGGMDSVRALDRQLEQDRAALDRLGERQRRLTERLAAVEIPIGTLERVT